uniref:ATP synthase subunit a n=1 Tax=Paraleius leontonychus TaxID=1807943 RepID=A0A330JER8_9ACAR|nr:ATP synthase F0 subunit 6 [Paraleius leontonychus]
MNNLFSIFDPASSSLNLCWMLMLALPILLVNQIWTSNTPVLSMTQKTLNFLLKEVAFTLKKTKKSELAYLISLFTFILIMNATALFPQVFSLTSHLVITLPLAVTSWLLINLFGWVKNTNHMLAHLVPQGTPVALMSFMVLIEMTSSIIRPITLCVRLTANMIAGHLLMTLLGNALMNVNAALSVTLIAVPLILTVLETAVAFIQSYVFMTLITLYVTEVK